jgi:predicted glycogen debranching enzyme
MRSGAVEIQPVPGLPRIAFRHPGVFVGSPDWWRRFEYLEDRTRAAEFQEDLWTPGTFELPLEPGVAQWWEAGVGTPPSETPAELFAESEAFWLAQDPGELKSPVERSLTVAVAAFRAVDAPEAGIIAGYPWLDVQVRELLISFPGVCLTGGSLEQAKSILRSLLRRQRGGWLPVWMPRRREAWGRPCPDATLWLFEAVRRLRAVLPPEDDFVSTVCYPKLVRAFLRLAGRRRGGAWLTEEGLLANGVPGQALTWMDSGQDDWVSVPRAGLAIEWQALWLRACETMGELAQERGHLRLAQRAVSLAARVRQSFPLRFWGRDKSYPFDVVSAERGEGEWADHSIRPNAVIALAVAPDLFEPWQATTLLDRVRLELVTPCGLRTLSSSDSRFCGYHEGALEEREQATHQGTVWPMLAGWYVRAALRNSGGDDALRSELRDYISHVADVGGAMGQVAQLADGEAPHRWRGLPAHACSAAMLLDVLVTDLAPVPREVGGVSRSAGSV